MSLINISTLPSGSLLGLWHIRESIEELLVLYPSLSFLYESIKSHGSKSRIIEKLAVHALLIEMTGQRDIIVGHNSDGRPFVDGWNISISHTKGFASVILSRSNEVAVDIEYISDRVSKMVSKFVREDEQADNLIQQLITWCTKETVYKYYSSQHLDFFDIRLQPFAPSNSGIIVVDNLRGNTSISVNYVVTTDYILTYID